MKNTEVQQVLKSLPPYTPPNAIPKNANPEEVFLIKSSYYFEGYRFAGNKQFHDYGKQYFRDGTLFRFFRAVDVKWLQK